VILLYRLCEGVNMLYCGSGLICGLCTLATCTEGIYTHTCHTELTHNQHTSTVNSDIFVSVKVCTF